MYYGVKKHTQYQRVLDTVKETGATLVKINEILANSDTVNQIEKNVGILRSNISISSVNVESGQKVQIKVELYCKLFQLEKWIY